MTHLVHLQVDGVVGVKEPATLLHPEIVRQAQHGGDDVRVVSSFVSSDPQVLGLPEGGVGVTADQGSW